MAEEEGLLGYGRRIVQLYRDVMSRQVAQVLRGTKAADIPVEQPTRFELKAKPPCAARSRWSSARDGASGPKMTLPVPQWLSPKIG
jgi:hypothetical protein